MRETRASGDLLADRRFRLGESYAADGAHSAAADLFEQTLERVPDWAPAWLALALAREQQGDQPRATAAFQRAEALDRSGALGASLHIARREAVGVVAMPAAYVGALFDQYADRFDDHLTGALQYCGPALIVEALERAGACAGPGAVVLDLGCGTGLMASALSRHVSAIDGVDLSPAMVSKARTTSLYRRLVVADLQSFLDSAPWAAYDLAVAADVLVYVGALEIVFAGVAGVLRRGGRFAFTTQLLDTSEGFRLGVDMRFSHSRAYVEAALAAAGFVAVEMTEASTRIDAGVAVPGLVAVACNA